MQNIVMMNKLFIMEKLCCCFSSNSDVPTLDVELKCAITCCVDQSKNIDVDMVDAIEDKEEEKDESSSHTKETCKRDANKKCENG